MVIQRLLLSLDSTAIHSVGPFRTQERVRGEKGRTPKVMLNIPAVSSPAEAILVPLPEISTTRTYPAYDVKSSAFW